VIYKQLISILIGSMPSIEVSLCGNLSALCGKKNSGFNHEENKELTKNTKLPFFCGKTMIHIIIVY
jgi:hypothetical protein